MNSRRTLLKASLLVGGSALIGGSLYCSREIDTPEIANKLTAFLDYPTQANTLGESLLNGDTYLSAMNLEALTNALLTQAEIERDELTCMRQSSLLERLHKAIYRDFSEANTQAIDGWLLSRTEAYLCALSFRTGVTG